MPSKRQAGYSDIANMQCEVPGQGYAQSPHMRGQLVARKGWKGQSNYKSIPSSSHYFPGISLIKANPRSVLLILKYFIITFSQF